MPTNPKTTRIQIEGMTCANCVRHFEQSLGKVPGVKHVRVSLTDGATVQHENVPEDQLLKAIRAAGDYRGIVIG